MPRLHVCLNALRENLETVSRACQKAGCACMFVLKEAPLHPKLTEAVLQDSEIRSVGTVAWPELPLPVLPGRELVHLCSPSAEQLPLAAACRRVFVSSITALRSLSAFPAARAILCLEAGDGRDGVPEAELPELLEQAHACAVPVDALSVNFACMSSKAPTAAALEHAAVLVRRLLPHTPRLSAGGSDILELAEHTSLPCEVAEIRCGTGVMLGVYPLSGRPVPGCRQDTFQLESRVLECRVKQGRRLALFDMGEYHTAPHLLTPPFPGMAFRASSSAYTSFDVTGCPESLKEGQALRFGLEYRSLSRALSSRALPLTMTDGTP